MRNEVVEGVALLMTTDEAPAQLRGKQLWKPDVGALLAGAKDGSEVVGRLKDVLAEVEAEKGRHILYVDEITSLVGATRVHGDGVAEILRAALAKGETGFIGATTAANYEAAVTGEAEPGLYFTKVPVGGDSGERAENEEASDDEKYKFAGDSVSPDLRELMEGGARTDRIKVVLQVGDTNDAGLNNLLKRSGARVSGRLARLGAMEVELPVSALRELSTSEAARYISLDRELVSLGHIETTTGAGAARKLSTNPAYDGKGVGIVVLDSSVFNVHYSFMGSDNNTRAVNVDYGNTALGLTSDDPYGHGTHVAALAAGNGNTDKYPASVRGKYTGVAPGAKVYNLRVLDQQGKGSTSGLLKALDWVLANHKRVTPNIRVVNLSLGAPAIDSYKNDPLCRAVRRLVDAGVVVVAAAGNDAAGNKIYGRIHSPGNEPSAITVGASNTYGTDARGDDSIATFSSRGPTRSHWPSRGARGRPRESASSSASRRWSEPSGVITPETRRPRRRRAASCYSSCAGPARPLTRCRACAPPPRTT